VIDPFQVIDLYGTDALRFYLLREIVFGGDGSVSPEGFEKRYTTELANEYGNLASRTLSMIARYRDGVVPVAAEAPTVASDLDGLAASVRERFDAVDITGALDEIWQRVRRLNQWVQEEAPWQLAKDPAAAARLDGVLYGLAEGLRIVSVLLEPFMPEKTEQLLGALGANDRSLDGARFRPDGRFDAIGELAPLFPRLEPAEPPAASPAAS